MARSTKKTFLLITGLSLSWLLLSVVSKVYAHPGRTDSSGGHTCRTNCPRWGLEYGEYHYHGGSSAPSTPKYTSPPAYKEPSTPKVEYQPKTTTPAYTQTKTTTQPKDESDNSGWWWLAVPVVIWIGAAAFGNASGSKKTTYSQPTNVNLNTHTKAGICPRCGGKLRYIKGRRGPFYGCSNFRSKGCRYTRNA